MNFTWYSEVKSITFEQWGNLLPKNKQIELDIELDFAKRAGVLGVAARKYIDPNVRGAPDRICLCPGGYTFFIEFKKPGERLGPLQIQYKEFLESLDFHVHECDNLHKAISILREEMIIAHSKRSVE